jgi:hypothetical protein
LLLFCALGLIFTKSEEEPLFVVAFVVIFVVSCLTRLLTQIERVLSVNDARLFLSKSSKPLATASSSVRPDCRAYDKQFLKLYDK